MKDGKLDYKNLKLIEIFIRYTQFNKRRNFSICPHNITLHRFICFPETKFGKIPLFTSKNNDLY